MSLVTPVTITMDQSTSTSFGQTMNQIRSWLDSKKIEPASFQPIVAGGKIMFEIGFRDEQDAKRFQREFV